MSRHPVSDPAAPRTWEPHTKARDEVMNMVLEIILQNDGEISQKRINTLLQERLGIDVKAGTVHAYVSASLLHFAQAGWVESTERNDERSPIWKVI